MKSTLIFLAVLALHVMVFWHVIQLASLQPIEKPLKPIMVSLIIPAPPAVPAVIKIPKKVVIPKKRTSRKKRRLKRRKKTVSKKHTLPKKTALSKKTQKTVTMPVKTTPAKKVALTEGSKTKTQKHTHYQKTVHPPVKTKVSVTIPPSYKYNPHPPYPRLSRKRGEEGTVVLKVKISINGNAAVIKLTKTSGFRRLDKAAIRQVKNKWRFMPAKKAGKSVTAWVTIPIIFKLM